MPCHRLIALLLLASWLPAQDSDRFRLDEATLRQHVERLAPVVEKIAGRKFVRTPEPLISDVSEVARALTADFIVQFRAVYPGESDAGIRRIAKERAGVFAEGLLGKYGFESRELYVLPDRVDLILGFYGVDDSLAESVFQLVLAHELVHALQDQEVDMQARVRRLTDQDAVHGVSCLIEGHAVFCSEAVARELGLEAAIPALRKVTGTQPVLAGPKGSAFIQRTQRWLGHAYYVAGTDFVAHHHQSGGNERLWQILAAAPPSTAMILRPAQYRSTWRHAEDYGSLLDGMESLFGRRRWRVARGSVAEVLLRSECLLGQDLVPILDDYRAGSFLEVEGPAATMRGSIYLLAFTDAETAQAFVEMAAESATEDARRRGDANDLRVEAGPFPGPPDTTCQRHLQTPLEFGGNTRGELVWCRRGRHVLQLTLHTLTLSDEEIVASFAEVLARLDRR